MKSQYNLKHCTLLNAHHINMCVHRTVLYIVHCTIHNIYNVHIHRNAHIRVV